MSPTHDNDYMTQESVTQVIALMALYWPSFVPKAEMATVWTPDLKKFTRGEIWAILGDLKKEENRVFAPSISEVLGRLEVSRKIEIEKVEGLKRLAAPKYSQLYDPLQAFTCKVSRTTPKRNNEEQDFELRTFLRVSDARFEEIKKRKLQQSLAPKKTRIEGNLNGAYRLEWVPA